MEGENEVLIGRTIVPVSRIEMADGTPAYAVAGEYRFRLLSGEPDFGFPAPVDTMYDQAQDPELSA